MTPPTPEPPVEPDVAPGPPSAAELAFADELSSGTVKIDPDIGILYLARPERWDDLTLLRGVAETVQERLHEQGIFTFKQIACWTDHQTEQLSQKMHLKGRAQRDRWVQQARDLHYLKYGEKVG